VFGPAWLLLPAFSPNAAGVNVAALGLNAREDFEALRCVASAGGTLGAPGDPDRLTRLADRSILDGVSLPWPGHAAFWGLKDPRFCATLKVWIDSGALKADSIRIIHVVRDPESIVRSSLEHPSVRKFCQGDDALARRMVHDYITLAEWQVRRLNAPTLHLAYEDLVTNAVLETERIADWLGLDDRRRIRDAARCVGKRSARNRYHLRRSLTFPFRAVRKACRLATR